MFYVEIIISAINSLQRTNSLVLFNRLPSYILLKWTGRGERYVNEGKWKWKRAVQMIFRLFILTIGFGLAVSGGISTIAYLNMITTGHGVVEYLSFISKRLECYFFPVGIGIIWLSIYWPNKNDEN